MKIVYKKKNIYIMLTMVVLIGCVLGYLYFNKSWIFEPVKTVNQVNKPEQKTDNVVDYSPPTNEQKTSQFEKSKDEEAESIRQNSGKIIIPNSGFTEEGNYEISVYSAETKDAGAKCVLLLNGVKNIEVDVQIYPHMAICKGFTIMKSDLRNGKNKYEIEFISGDYRDKISGEF